VGGRMPAEVRWAVALVLLPCLVFSVLALHALTLGYGLLFAWGAVKRSQLVWALAVGTELVGALIAPFVVVAFGIRFAVTGHGSLAAAAAGVFASAYLVLLAVLLLRRPARDWFQGHGPLFPVVRPGEATAPASVMAAVILTFAGALATWVGGETLSVAARHGNPGALLLRQALPFAFLFGLSPAVGRRLRFVWAIGLGFTILFALAHPVAWWLLLRAAEAQELDWSPRGRELAAGILASLAFAGAALALSRARSRAWFLAGAPEPAPSSEG